MATTVSLFDDEFLKKLEYLSILSKRLFAGQLKAAGVLTEAEFEAQKAKILAG